LQLARYIARRFFRSGVLLIGASFLSFTLLELAPGDYFDEVLLNPAVSRQMVETLRAQYGLNHSVPVRYLHWCASAVRGEWGMSIAYQRPAGPVIWERARNTLVLTIVGTLASWLVGLGVALWAAAGKLWRQTFVLSVAAILAPLPDLVLVLGLTVLASETGWLPAGGMTSPDYTMMSPLQRVGDSLMHLVLPAFALTVSLLPIVMLHARSAIAELISAPFIVFAQASGIPRMRLLIRHVLPAASAPLITVAGFSVGGMLSSALVIEVITGWPGLGSLMLQSIMRRDPYVVLGAITASATLLLLTNFMADLLLFAADPRIRRE
jgi:peptide/nickel transport system permease protein